MTRMLILAGVATAVTLIQPVTIAQGKKPPEIATDIVAAEVQAVLDAPSTIADRLITAVDMGTYNVGVGVLRRTPTKPGAPVGAINHEHITEVYYIISRHRHAGHRRHRHQRTSGGQGQRDRQHRRRPQHAGHVRQAGAAPQGDPGDVVIIPPGVYHGFDDVPAGGIDYLAVRPDPNKVLPAGYVHPAIKALKK